LWPAQTPDGGADCPIAYIVVSKILGFSNQFLRWLLPPVGSFLQLMAVYGAEAGSCFVLSLASIPSTLVGLRGTRALVLLDWEQGDPASIRPGLQQNFPHFSIIETFDL
jgi:hypothetical protein